MTDLTLHFIAGFIISFVILMLKKPVMARRPDWLVLTAIGASIAVAVAKEAGDYFLHWGTAEVADITLTWSGGMVALAVVALVDWIIYKRGNT
jgi:glycopeptide antibiotics resistance protein